MNGSKKPCRAASQTLEAEPISVRDIVFWKTDLQSSIDDYGLVADTSEILYTLSIEN